MNSGICFTKFQDFRDAMVTATKRWISLTWWPGYFQGLNFNPFGVAELTRWTETSFSEFKEFKDLMKLTSTTRWNPRSYCSFTDPMNSGRNLSFVICCFWNSMSWWTLAFLSLLLLPRKFNDSMNSAYLVASSTTWWTCYLTDALKPRTCFLCSRL